MRVEQAAACLFGIIVWAICAAEIWAFTHTYLVPLTQDLAGFLR